MNLKIINAVFIKKETILIEENEEEVEKEVENLYIQEGFFKTKNALNYMAGRQDFQLMTKKQIDVILINQIYINKNYNDSIQFDETEYILDETREFDNYMLYRKDEGNFYIWKGFDDLRVLRSYIKNIGEPNARLQIKKAVLHKQKKVFKHIKYQKITSLITPIEDFIEYVKEE